MGSLLDLGSSIGSFLGSTFSNLGSAINPSAQGQQIHTNAQGGQFFGNPQQMQMMMGHSSPAPIFQQPSLPAANISAQSIQQGLQRSGFGNAPVATMSADFARAGQQMPANGDPYMPIVMSLMETGGGQYQVGQNNMLNIRGTQNGQTQFVNYPNPQTALFGGNNGGVPSAGFVGMINHSVPSQADFYGGYRQTGNLADFFNHYTPQGEGNPTLDQLIARYNALRSNFK